jgi:methionyl-tRNA formyltransferase
MQIIALGTSRFLIYCVRGLIDAGFLIKEIISLPEKLLPDNSVVLKNFAAEINANYFEIEDINSKSAKQHLRLLTPDIIFSSWPKIIDCEVLKIPSLGIIGTHPTQLPFNKGRHPLHWQIVLGLKESKLSYFWMDSGVDSGPIILQIPYKIESSDTIITLSERVNDVAHTSSYMLGLMLKKNNISKGFNQKGASSNTWRKRDRHDVLIDFRMNGDDIISLIRSFVDPYPGATIIFEDNLINILSGEKIEPIFHVPLAYLEPGYIIKVDNKVLIIKAANMVLKLYCRQNLELILNNAKYVHPPTKYMIKYPKIASLFF